MGPRDIKKNCYFLAQIRDFWKMELALQPLQIAICRGAFLGVARLFFGLGY